MQLCYNPAWFSWPRASVCLHMCEAQVPEHFPGVSHNTIEERSASIYTKYRQVTEGYPLIDSRAKPWKCLLHTKPPPCPPFVER